MNIHLQRIQRWLKCGAIEAGKAVQILERFGINTESAVRVVGDTLLDAA